MRAIEPVYQKIEYTIMTEGRYVNAMDMQQKRKVLIMGDLAKEKLFGKEVTAIGEYVRINGTKFQIVGIFTDSNKREREFIYMPLTTAQSVFDKIDRVHDISLTVGDATVEEANVIADNIRAEPRI